MMAEEYKFTVVDANRPVVNVFEDLRRQIRIVLKQKD
jgi:thymidylate kinase